VAFDAWNGPNARVGLTLIDPNGVYTAYTRPQGNGNHGQVDVRKPVAGTWTALVFKRDGTFSGPVHLEFQSQRFGSVDSVSPSSLTLRPGQTGRLRVHLRLPNAPGDSGQDLVLNSSTGDSTVVPIVLRSLISLGSHGGNFAGTIIGGNGRNGNEQPAQQNTFAFDVPRGEDALRATLTFDDNDGTEVQGYLIDPDGNMLGAGTTLYQPLIGNQQFTHAFSVIHREPQKGRWLLVVNIVNPVGGEALSVPYRGRISFDGPSVSARGLPSGEKLKAGVPVTATISVRNDSPAIEDVFADPRLKQSEDVALLAASQPGDLDLPGAASAWVMPTQTTEVLGVAEATAPIELEMAQGTIGEGDPDIRGISSGNQSVAPYSAGEVPPGFWFLAPALKGPFDAPTTGKVNTGMLVHTRSFDTNADSTTGDWERFWVDPDFVNVAPLTLQPGQRGTITVTFTPQGKKGDVVKGEIYIDDINSAFLDFTNEQIALPYRYRIG
jgi:hypothetical protein